MLAKPKFEKIHSTRFSGLGYTKVCAGLWMFIDTETEAQIGPQYSTREELLADLRAFAEERGFTS